MLGRTLAHYEISELLGAGGMGEVYRAHDGKLGRDIALKILPRELSGDPERLARFEREARTLASLQHAHVASIYGFEESDGIRFLVMELVEGEDLEQRIARGKIAVAEAVEIALQMAQGLEAAHERGIVHRDLKPANVKLAADGQVKILDFGLARAYAGPEEFDGDPATSPTITAAMTQAGTILGTAAYMSPEQARGRSVDKRADIWAFGVVLYEMLAGRRAFEGETISDTLAAVLRAEPDRGALAAKIPAALTTLLDRCLEKNPRRRLRDIGEATILLEDLREGRSPSSVPQADQAIGNARPIWFVAVVAALLLGAAAAWLLHPAPPEAPLRKIRLDLGDFESHSATISPDARHLAYLGDHRLWILNFEQLEPRALAQNPDGNFRPVWSPDSDQVAFVNEHQLLRVAVAGGSPTPICTVPNLSGGAGGSWTADGRILFVVGRDHVYEVPAGGGVSQIFLEKDDEVDADLHEPQLLPDGKSLLLVRHSRTLGPATISIHRDGVYHDLHRHSPGSYEDPIYDPRGYVLASRRGSGEGIWALPISLNPPQLTGEPFLISAGSAYPSLARDGTLVHRLGSHSEAAALVLIDAEGTVLQQLTDFEQGHISFSIAPNGRQVALALRGMEGADIDVYDFDRGLRTHFATGAPNQNDPSWTRDGRQIVYGQSGRLMIRPADASSGARVLGVGSFPTVMPDGQHVLYTVDDQNSNRDDIWMRSLTDRADSTVVLATPAAEWNPSVSADGNHMLYSSDDSGVREAYLSRFPVGPRRWQVSTGGGDNPEWSASGDAIYYLDQENNLYQVDVDWQEEPVLSAPKLLFSLDERRFQTWGRIEYRPAHEPGRFYVLQLSDEQSSVSTVLVENWMREFAKR